MILAFLVEAATDNLSVLKTPDVPVPTNVPGMIGGVLAAFASVLSLVYLGYRKVMSDKREDSAGNVQQSVLAQVAALTESNQKVISEEREYSASLKKRLDDEMERAARRDAEHQASIIAWAQERQRILEEWETDRRTRAEECDIRTRQLSDSLDQANIKVTSLESQVTRLTDNARSLGDQITALRAQGGAGVP